MSRNIRKWIPLAVMLIGMTVYLQQQFDYLFECPSCHLFVDSSDGLKNYWTAAYYVKHDDTGIWSKGMNYPYGEHVVYTDNQPIVSAILKAIDAVIPMDEHVIGTINMLMVISLIIAALVLYLILREFGLPRWYAAIMSIPIALLSPQIARFNGHYSLAYACYLPVFLLLLIRWAKGGFSLGKGAILTAWIVFMGFTHLYFFFIASLLLLAFAFTHWLLRRFKLSRASIRSVAVMLLAATVVYGSVKVTDTVKDRPETVYGMYVYTAKLKGTFLPWYAPMNTVWEGIGKSRPNIEGTAYLGAPVVLLFLPILVWSVVMMRRRYFKKAIASRGNNRLGREPAHPLVLFISGFLVWFVATGWFYEIGGEKLVDLFPVIGQFRSLGRVAWVSYYIFGLSTAYAMYSIVHAKEARWKAVALTIFFSVSTLFWIWEGHAYLESEVLTRPISTNNTFKGSTPYSDMLDRLQLDADHFQAILQFPTASCCAEKISIDRGAWWMRQSWQCAWETGLPIVNTQMSRTSVGQTLSLIQLLSDPYIEKVRMRDMDSRPFILLVGQEEKYKIDAERRLVSLADSLDQINDVIVYSLNAEAFNQEGQPQNRQPLFAIDFDDEATELSFDGSGAFYSEGDFREFFSFQDTFTTRSVLQFSAWSHLGPRSPIFANVRHDIYNTSGDRVHRAEYNQFTYSPHNVIGNWIETSFYLGVDGSGATHRFYVGPEGSWLDNVRFY